MSLRGALLGCGAVVAASMTALPLTASAANSSKVTISGHSDWVLFIDAAERAAGYQSSCDASNGAIKVWGGAKARLLKTVANKPRVLSHQIDDNGNESWHCNMAYSTAVQREPKYAVAWANGTPNANSGCDNSKSRSDAQIWNDNGSNRYGRATMSFTYLCTSG